MGRLPAFSNSPSSGEVFLSLFLSLVSYIESPFSKSFSAFTILFQYNLGSNIYLVFLNIQNISLPQYILGMVAQAIPILAQRGEIVEIPDCLNEEI